MYCISEHTRSAGFERVVTGWRVRTVLRTGVVLPVAASLSLGSAGVIPVTWRSEKKLRNIEYNEKKLIQELVETCINVCL